MREIRPGVYAVGAIDWDARLFDRLIPLPDGTSYNSYFIRGSEKTALIDTVDPVKTDVLLENLVEAGAEKIDYLVVLHAEQDHSGSVPEILMLHPEAKVVTNAKCKTMLMDHLGVSENEIIVVQDGETLSLGDKTLQFVFTPWVHWPETMGSYLVEDKIYFSCDFFGSHVATSSLFVRDWGQTYEAAKRYFAEIMMPFRTSVRSNIARLDALDIEMIAPSHGPIHDNPSLILDAYRDWVSDEVKNEVVVGYVSMHGSIAAMVAYFVDALINRGIDVKQFELSTLDSGKLAMALVDAATVVIGSPTVLAGAHPCAAYAAFLANTLRPKTKFASIIGSYGWGGKMVEQLVGMMPNLKAEIIEPVLSKGSPKEREYAALDALADTILAKHKEIGIA